MSTGEARESSLLRDLTSLQDSASASSFLEVAFDAVVAFDSQERIISWNPAAEQIFGWKSQEVLGKTSDELFWPESTPQEWEEKKQRQMRLERGETLCGEFNPCRKDDSNFRAQYTARGIFDADGNFTGYLAVYRENQDAKSAFRESDEKYRRIVETSNEGIWEIDKDTRTTFVNRRMAEMLGYSVDEMMGRSSFEFLFPEDSPNGERRLERAKTGIPSNASEFRFRRKDGSVLWALVTTSPQMDEQGRFLGSFAMIVDVTERRQLEQQLEQNHHRLNEVLESIQDDFYVLDRNWNFVYASRLFTSKIGKEPQDFVGNNIWEMFPKHLGTTFEENLHAAMEKREIRSFEITGKYTDAWYRMKVFPSAEGITVLGTDITERRRAEEILRENEHKFFLLFEKAGFAAALSELPEGVLVDVNEEWVNQFGYTKQEAIGKTTLELNINPDEQGRARILAQLQEKGAAHNIETKLRTKSGEWRTYLTNVNLIDIGGKKYIFNAVQDITERKRVEDALRASERQMQLLNESLEQKVQEKTAEIRRLAADTTKAVQRERHRISHILHDDLQQGIYAIQMQLTFLRYEFQKENEIARHELSDIERQIAEVLEITRHLSVDLSPPILPDEGLAHAINWLASQMLQRYGLPIEIQADGPFIIPNEELQVFLFNCVRELLFNVVKHSGASQALVALHWLDEDLQIEVRDNGGGFSPEIFEQQLIGKMSGEESLQASYGLPTIRNQLSLFGGRMEIDSKPGEGTKVFLSVPIRQPG